jgi:CDP-paratose 2-epimerase
VQPRRSAAARGALGDRVRHARRPGVERNLAWLRATHGDQVHAMVADVRDADAVRRAVREAGEVYHFAAQVAVTTSLGDPVEDFDVNARGTLHVLEALRRVADERGEAPPLLFTSTNKVYGDLGDVAMRPEGRRYAPEDVGVHAHGISERRALDFHSPYGCSKGRPTSTCWTTRAPTGCRPSSSA